MGKKIKGGKYSQRRGKRGERLAVHLLEKLGMKNPRRGMSQSMGAIEADVVSDSTRAFWLEIKNTEKGRCIYSYIEQAESDSLDTPKIPLVLFKSNNKEWLVIGKAEFVLPILAGHTAI